MSRRIAVVVLSLLFVLSFTSNAEAAVSAPTFNPASPAKAIDSVTVTLSSATKGAAIVYTVDGTDPKTSKTARTYSSPLTLDRTTTISANAKLGTVWSGSAFGTYTITVPAPAITPSSRAFLQNVSLRITNIHPLSDTIRYTLDGTVPTSKSPLYVDLGVPLLALTNTTVVKAKAFRSGATESATTEMRYPRAVLLLVHGLNSDPATPWRVLVSSLFPADSRNIDVLCPRVSRTSGAVPPAATCYRADFGSKTVNGVTWNNGDGEQFSDYASALNGMIANIQSAARPQVIILVGHSRGGLAARSYLQTYSPSQITFGLLTVGTPHQGSPLGRIYVFYQSDSKYKLTSTELTAWQKKDTQLRFVFAPSTAALATDHDAQGKPISSAISSAIYNLNSRVSQMSKSTKAFGQVNSTGLDLGVDLGPFATNLLADIWLKKMATDGLLPGPFDPRLIALRAWILKNLTTEWNRGDGAVPEASADLTRIFSGTVSTTKLTNKRHTQLSEETIAINRQLESLIDALNKQTPNWSTSASGPTATTLSADATTDALRERNSAAALLDVLNFAPDSDAAMMARSELRTIAAATRRDEREAVSDLMLQRLILPASREDRALLMQAIAGIGTEGGVRALLHEYLTADDDDRAIIADALSSVRDDDSVDMLAAHLNRPGDPLATISGETLSNMAAPRATAALLAWARQSQDVAAATRWFSRIREIESLHLLQDSARDDVYVSREMQIALADLASEIDRQSTPIVDRN